MKITVITVCFNSERHIADALVSVDGQTHGDIEHIIIDGASCDGTMNVIRAHEQPWRCVLSEPDGGIYEAMNKGLALASGDVVGFLNADDMLASPDTLASIARIAASEDIDAVCGNLVYVRQDRPDTVLRYWRCGAFARSRLRFGWMPPHPSFYVTRTLLDAVGGFDTSLRIAADYDFMLRCLTRPGARTAYLNEVLVRMRTGGVSNRSLATMRAKSREDLTVMRRHGVGGWFTLLSKNLRKLPQFVVPPSRMNRRIKDTA